MTQAADDIPKAIEWHEGMMLAPQHFQVSGRRLEQMQAYHAERLQPFYWGIRSLEIDEVLVVEGRCRVLALDAVLPDGTPVAHSTSRELELEVDLSEHAEEAREEPVTVHVCLPDRPSLDEAGASERYRSVQEGPVVDQATGTRSLRIPRRAPRLRLLVAETPPSEYVTLPIARVANTESGFELTDYEPPRLHVPRSSGIGTACQSLLERLRAKARSLRDRLQSSAVRAGSMQALDGRQTVHALTAELPRLEAQLRSEQVHPFTLYQSLCRLAGDAARLTQQRVPPAFADYDHSALRATFGEVVSYILRAVTQGVQEAYTPFPFHSEDDGFALAFQEEWKHRGLILAVRGRPQQDKQALRRWGENCLIGAASRLEALHERRVLGVERTPIERTDALVPGRDTVLFRLTPSPAFIEPGEDLVVRRAEKRSSSDRPLELTLYVKKEDVE